jgi:hypothetical protein
MSALGDGMSAVAIAWLALLASAVATVALGLITAAVLATHRRRRS